MKNIAPSIRSSIDKDSQEFKSNKKMMEEKNKKKVKNKKDENPMERISRILYGGNK